MYLHTHTIASRMHLSCRFYFPVASAETWLCVFQKLANRKRTIPSSEWISPNRSYKRMRIKERGMADMNA